MTYFNKNLKSLLLIKKHRIFKKPTETKFFRKFGFKYYFAEVNGSSFWLDYKKPIKTTLARLFIYQVRSRVANELTRSRSNPKIKARTRPETENRLKKARKLL